MVTQENFLFSGTIAENIAFGRPDAHAGPRSRRPRRGDRRRHASSAPCPTATTPTSASAAGGSRPGSGSWSRSPAAFLADPAVLILDEATSSLDIPSERLVQRALRTILADRTAFVIAHRLSTVEIADRVLVVEGGRIVEDGPPASWSPAAAATPPCTSSGATASSEAYRPYRLPPTTPRSARPPATDRQAARHRPPGGPPATVRQAVRHDLVYILDLSPYRRGG